MNQDKRVVAILAGMSLAMICILMAGAGIPMGWAMTVNENGTPTSAVHLPLVINGDAPAPAPGQTPTPTPSQTPTFTPTPTSTPTSTATLSPHPMCDLYLQNDTSGELCYEVFDVGIGRKCFAPGLQHYGEFPSGIHEFSYTSVCSRGGGNDYYPSDRRTVSFTCAAPTPTPSQTPTFTPTPTGTPTPTETSTFPRTEALCVDVIDGDTIRVNIGGGIYTLRYIGIDAPETVHPSEPVEWMGPEASAANEALVGGQTVYLEKDVSETDYYGRLLRYVFLADGTLVNAEMVWLGYALVSTYPPDVRYASLFLEMQEDARGAERGLWGPTPTPTATTTATPTPTIQSAVCGCSANLYNCADFATQAQAQACFEYCISQGQGDIHRLDGDNDGLACEALP